MKKVLFTLLAAVALSIAAPIPDLVKELD